MTETNFDNSNNLQYQFKQLEELKKKAEYTNQIKSEFLSNISHDLRNPITSIIGFANRILEGKYGGLSFDQKEPLQLILQSGQHALSLINKLLNLSKIQYKNVSISLSKFEIQELGTFIIKMNEIKSNNKHIPINFSYSKDCGMIYTDHDKLIEILGNLLNNALNYTDEGEVGLKIEKKGTFYEFSIWDTGIGIQEEEFYLLFQPYSRVHPKDLPLKDGIGLGLYHVKQLVELLRGSIFLESQPHKGSKFFINIPETYSLPDSMQKSKNGAFFFGLKKAGKTTIINYFQNIPAKSYNPTFALIISHNIDSDNIFDLIDCPGDYPGDDMYWENGLNLAKVLIFVLDISEPDSFSLAYSEFRRVLLLKVTEGLPVLILFHKFDLNVTLSNFNSAERLFNLPIAGHKFFFFNTSIKIPDSMKSVNLLIKDLLLKKDNGY